MNSIKFGDGKAYLITSKKLIDGLLSQLEKRWSIQPFAKPFKYETERITRSNLKNLRKTEYLVHPNTVGTKYLLYFTVYANKKYVLFISPKYEKIIAAKNLFPPKKDATQTLFTDTIIKTELVKSNVAKKWYLLANDIIVKHGDDLRSTKVSYPERLSELFKLEKQLENRFEGTNFEINTITDSASFKHLATKVIPALKYPTPGVIFVPKFQKYGQRSLIYNLPISENTPAFRDGFAHPTVETAVFRSDATSEAGSESTLTKYITSGSTKLAVSTVGKPIFANFEVNMTSMSDVYQLYYYDAKNKLTNYGIGYIENIDHSHKMLAIFKKVNPTPIPDHPDLYELKLTMRCQYDPRFKKWKPIEPTTKSITTEKDLTKLEPPIKM